MTDKDQIANANFRQPTEITENNLKQRPITTLTKACP